MSFLDRLPHALIASFRSTLAEAHDAQLVLHVVDAADPAWRRQAAVTEQVLAELGGEATTWLVLNKIDRVSDEQRAAIAAELPAAIATSALDPRDAVKLRERIATFFAGLLVEERLSIPYARQGELAALRDRVHVVSEEYGEALEVTVRAPRELLPALRALGAQPSRSSASRRRPNRA
jgi:GTPase